MIGYKALLYLSLMKFNTVIAEGSRGTLFSREELAVEWTKQERGIIRRFGNKTCQCVSTMGTSTLTYIN